VPLQRFATHADGGESLLLTAPRAPAIRHRQSEMTASRPRPYWLGSRSSIGRRHSPGLWRVDAIRCQRRALQRRTRDATDARRGSSAWPARDEFRPASDREFRDTRQSSSSPGAFPEVRAPSALAGSCGLERRRHLRSIPLRRLACGVSPLRFLATMPFACTSLRRRVIRRIACS
jgi:hypothetical protein